MAVFNSPVTRVRLGAPAAFGSVLLYVLRKHNPPQSATDYIALVIEHVVKLVPDTGHLPTRADIDQLGNICTALEYAIAITAEIKRELESRLANQSDMPMH